MFDRCRQLLVGDSESIPGPQPTLKTLLYTLAQPLTLTNSPVQSPQSSPAHSPTSVQFPPPKKTPSTLPAPTLTPYTLDLIQPIRPDSPHLPPPYKHPYATQHHQSPLFTSPSPLHHLHPHTAIPETNKIPPKQNTKK